MDAPARDFKPDRLFGGVRRPWPDSSIVSATPAQSNLPPMPTRFNAAFTALLAAALFGATTPLASHAPITHAHAHFPDIHHRHTH